MAGIKTDASLTNFTSNFTLEIAKGNVPGINYVHKFGEAQDIDTGENVDIWDGPTQNTNLKIYTFSQVADIDAISSTVDTDTQDIEVQGLDTNWNLSVQTKTLTGQTTASLTTPLLRVFRMKNSGSLQNDGNIYCYVDDATVAGAPSTIGNTRAIMSASNNQTLMAIYSVPDGKTAYMDRFFASTAKKITQVSNVSLFVRPFGGVFQLKYRSSIQTTGTSFFERSYIIPEKIVAKSDIKIVADSSANDGAVAAGFDLILIDN